MTAISKLEQAYLAHRAKLMRFVVARGAGDAAEDVLQELWLRLAAAPDLQAACEPAYMMRAADRLMIDRYRSDRQAALREKAWVEAQPGLTANGTDVPDSERELAARQQVELVQQALDEMGPRPAAMFRRHRIDGLPQRVIAEEFGVSRGTVENDLRRVYARIAEIRRAIDEE